MVEIRNVLKEKLEAGGLALGAGLRGARSVDAVALMTPRPLRKPNAA